MEVSSGAENDPRQAIWERAKLDGADFRAVGNEPGWSLEIIAGNRILLITGYGASRIELPLPEPDVDQTNRRTRWDAGELIVEVTGRPCRDSMSGEIFETEVSVHGRGRCCAAAVVHCTDNKVTDVQLMELGICLS